jgi:ammonia channel protein AmtB
MAADELASCINTGDTTWVLVSSILVLSMMPALSFFEGKFLSKVDSIFFPK